MQTRAKTGLTQACLLVIGVIFLTRIPVALLARRAILLNVDELRMTLSTIDRFLGVPPVSLAWPGGPLQFLSLPVIGMDYLFSSQFHPSLVSFAGYMSRLYREPWRVVLFARCIAALGSSVGFGLLYLLFVRWTKSRLVGTVCVGVLATCPQVWMCSHMATGDSLAMGFACAALTILCLNSSSARSFRLAGFLIGLAVASKITIAVLLPFVLAAGLQRSTQRIRHTGWFLACLGAGFIFGCPYVWTDPVRLAKGMFGNVTRAGMPIGVWAAFMRLGRISSVVPLLLCVPAVCCIIRRKEWWFLAGSMISLAATLISTGNAGVVYDRYFVPAILVVVCLSAVLLGWLREWCAKPQELWRRAGYVLCLSVLVLAAVCNVFGYVAIVNEETSIQEHKHAVMEQLRASDIDGEIIVPLALLPYIAAEVSTESLRDLARDCRAGLTDSRSVALFAESRGISRDVTDVLGYSFSEDEQAFAARLWAMSYSSASDGLTVRVWGQRATCDRFGLMTEAEAIARFTDGRAEALVLHRDPGSNLTMRASLVSGQYHVLTGGPG